MKSLGFSRFVLEYSAASEAGEDIRIRRTFYSGVSNPSRTSTNEILFFKPSSRENLVKALNDYRIHGISLDRTNYHLLKKNLLHLIKIKNKFIEIRLNESSSELIRRSIEWGYNNIKIVFSSCASTISDVWPPLSLFNYLLIHGASSSRAIVWISRYPMELFNIVSDIS
ncbi:MAG: hypothetical protein QXY37_03770 [Metallosphaera sp.]